MSFENVLIIKQYQDTDIANCKAALESSPEKYSVTIANTYHEGYRLLRDRSIPGAERLSVVIVDADEVDSYAMDLLTSLRGMNYYKEVNDYLPVIVMTNLANDLTRRTLSSMSSECIIKTGRYDKYLWNLVKKSLQRNPKHSRTLRIKARQAFRAYPMTKKKVQPA
jgi:hypothetical protein